MKRCDKLEDFVMCKRFLAKFPDRRTDFNKCLDHFDKTWNRSKTISQLKIVIKIAYSNANFYDLYLEYIQCDSVKRKLEIGSGAEALKLYLIKLKARPKPIHLVTNLQQSYWLNRGYSLEDSIQKISEIQKSHANKRTAESYKHCTITNQICAEYWLHRGYSTEEAEELRKPYVNNCKNDLSSMINRHGEEIGTNRYLAKIAKYKASMIANLSQRRTGGYVSKESLRFFIPLYKFCRRLGILRNDICFGIDGSREFFIRDNSFAYNTGKFYDFTIKSLNMIIEYHGCYWHPKKIEDWRNPNDYYITLEADRYKEKLAIDFGMGYHIVWSDCDKLYAFKHLTTKIQKLYDKQR